MFCNITGPSRKRQRTLESVEKSSPKWAQISDNEEPSNSSSSRDSGSLLEEGTLPLIDNEPSAESAAQTELESALPFVKTDQQAIDEYEASKAAELAQSEEPTILERCNARQWVKGRSSIYVDAFNLALESVLADEAHLFNEAEMAVFDYWKGLSYESQYLYVRLFLRKTSAWHRISRLGYYDDVADLPAAVSDLRRERDLPVPSVDHDIPGFESSSAAQLGKTFRFADGLEQLTTLEEASSLLLLEELKTITKEAKIQGKNKKELLIALRETSSSQTALAWNSPSNTGNGGLESFNSVNRKTTRDDYFRQKTLNYTGDCIRLSAAPLRLFERVHLVFYRSTQWTEKSLTAIILAKISRRNYPEYIVSRSTGIFPSRSALLEFENSLRVQFELDNALLSGALSTDEKLQNVKSLAERIYPRWRALIEEEQLKERREYEFGEGAYLRRFSPAWVYTRIIHKGLQALARFKEYKREHELLTELLSQRLFHPARRGCWYQRKALLEEHYMWSLTPSNGLSDEARKREWKRKALRTCEQGLEDPECHVIYHYDLQKRIIKLEKSLRIPKREQHDFGHVLLAKPLERTVHGIRVEKCLPVKRMGKVNGEILIRRVGPTLWIDEREGGAECRVESMCLNWYRDNGWKGFHCENGILRTLFGYLFYDVLFTYVPNVFQTPFQTCPLDLHTDSFYASRASEINQRLVQISNGGAEQLIREVHERESEKQTCVIGIDWSFTLEDLVEIAQCFDGQALATVCKVMAQEYQQRGSGVPDLFLWRMDTKEVMFSEVKSENDRLSDAQRVWIHVLIGAGVKVELCNAVAREVRYV
ncbi:hypothetical protein VTO42DRAFT_1118 [Malbranchea cinnamomea]